MTELQIQDERNDGIDRNRDPITGAPGAHPVGTGLGAATGAAAGAAMGSMAGPAGLAVGGIVGAVVGGLAGKGVGEAINPTTTEESIDRANDERFGARLDPANEELYWQRAFITEPYFRDDYTFDDYGPAYRVGFLHREHHAEHRTWEEAEAFLQTEWERDRGASRLDWEDARDPIRAAWHRADRALDNSGDRYFGVE